MPPSISLIRNTSHRSEKFSQGKSVCPVKKFIAEYYILTKNKQGKNENNKKPQHLHSGSGSGMLASMNIDEIKNERIDYLKQIMTKEKSPFLIPSWLRGFV